MIASMTSNKDNVLDSVKIFLDNDFLENIIYYNLLLEAAVLKIAKSI